MNNATTHTDLWTPSLDTDDSYLSNLETVSVPRKVKKEDNTKCVIEYLELKSAHRKKIIASLSKENN